MKDRIKGGVITNGTRMIFVKPTREGYTLTEKGEKGERKIKKEDIEFYLCRGYKKVD
jgi:hypothetical protein